MFRGNGAEGHAHDGIGAGGEDVHFAVINQRAFCVCDAVRKCKTHAAGFANPVFLHQAHPLWPAIQSGFFIADLNVIQQFLCVSGDLEVVTRNLALFYGCACAPAFAVNDLLVGKHGVIHGVPVHDLGFLVGNAFFQHFQEEPLIPFVVFGIAGRDFAAPINAQAQCLHLPFHGGDVVVSPLRGWNFVFQRGIFGRQTKRIPAHRHKNVVAFHAQMAHEHVVNGVIAYMPHVEFAAGVRQHGAGVELRFGSVFGDAVCV